MKPTSLIKKIIPLKVFKTVQPFYHYVLAHLAVLCYSNPSKKMLVVGVTGTTGKSSTCYFTAQILENLGLKVGLSSTTVFKIGEKEWLNSQKMTMPGRFGLQAFLQKCLKQKCQVVIIETSSQGIDQFRHKAIDYDVLVFTNLYPEHIEAHGSFRNYKKAKQKLFDYLKKTKYKKQIKNSGNQDKTIIVNSDDQHAKDFSKFWADQKKEYSLAQAKNLKIDLLGEYNRYNVLAAVEVAKSLGFAQEEIDQTVSLLKPLPGRLEFIENDFGFKILVDYAFEPKAIEQLYKTIKGGVEYKKLIHLLGSTGGGHDPSTQRDKSRRPVLGKMAMDFADTIIITNEDPYDEDPERIIQDVAKGARENNSQNKEILTILDRRQAIEKALSLAQKGDLVLITGKGAEQAMCLENGKIIPWDDRKVVGEILKNYC